MITDKKLPIKGTITNSGVTSAVILEHRETQKQLFPLHTLILSFNEYQKKIPTNYFTLYNQYSMQ